MRRNAESCWSNAMTKNVYKVKGRTTDHCTSVFKAHTHHRYAHTCTHGVKANTQAHETASVYNPAEDFVNPKHNSNLQRASSKNSVGSLNWRPPFFPP